MNILTKGKPGAEYIIIDMIATPLSKSAFLKAQALNKELLGDYSFVPANETDFSWWDRISKKLTKTRIKTAYFEIDFYGKVTEL